MRGSIFSAKRLRVSSVVLAMVMVVATLAAYLTTIAGPLEKPQANDRQITLVVVSLMRRDHLSKHKLDDEMSRRGLDQFLKSLDPLKVYFYQSDVDEFMADRQEIDDMLKRGDISFAYTIFNRFLQRVDERVAMIDKLLSEEHDLTDDEELVTDRDLLRYAKTPEESRERWRKRIEYDLLVLKSDETVGEAAVEKLSRRYHSFDKRMHQFDSDELLEMYLTSVTSSYDPHTTYMAPSSLENFQIQMRLELEGIGAALRSADGQTVVTKIIPGGAAEKNGKLKPEDKIVSVGEGDEGEMTDIVDMKLNDVVKRIRGQAGTVVKLGVISEGTTETKVYKITRAKIELKDSEARGVIFEDGKKPDGSAYKVGVIDLPSFYMDMDGARAGLADFKSTTRDVRKLLDDFTAKHVDVVILDLRRNGGGSLTEAINLSGLFIDQGPMVQVKDSDGRVQKYDDLDRGMAWEGPLVVLTSKFSASASEILAGAIQDYGRGLIVGDESTHGKGTVQSLLDLGQQLFRIPNPPNLGALKITMQQFYRPSGDSTQQRGVLADISLPSVTNHMDVGEADLDFALAFDKVDPAEFTKLDRVQANQVSELKARSVARRAESEDWAKLLRNIERYRDQKQRKSVSLNEAKFNAQRAELDADKIETEELEEQINGQEEIVKRDFYFEEVMRIALDYVALLQGQKLAIKN
ncbi:carboxy terminal-processing peptidase [Lignipirellula cremea]|uniref:Tail-specific protease n=1 Tax=Lignipirellula cremea TaxID=2528010 RepID=A0A518E0G5_9BACT|nr:carboxy terminal-processing peptidase [Lignipirellula cremea]QDU97569.1 Tail-specific protease precursor [Lignipirellula cremea]